MTEALFFLYILKSFWTCGFFNKLYLIRGNHTKHYLTFYDKDTRIANNPFREIYLYSNVNFFWEICSYYFNSSITSCSIHICPHYIEPYCLLSCLIVTCPLINFDIFLSTSYPWPKLVPVTERTPTKTLMTRWINAIMRIQQKIVWKWTSVTSANY